MLSKLKVLNQLTARQGLLLIIGFLINKITGKNPSFISKDIFVMGDQMSNIVENGHEISKKEKYNIIKFKNSAGEKDMTLCLRRMTTDFNIYGQIFRFQEYKPLIDIVNNLSKKKVEYIVDAGANVGCSTVYFKLLFPNAKVVAIEPESGNFNILKKNIELNEMQGDVFAEKAGLWKDNSNLEITTDFRDGREYAFWFHSHFNFLNFSSCVLILYYI